MAGKFESQFKYRDESNLNAMRPRKMRVARKPLFADKAVESQIRFTVAFGETITIAASLMRTQRRIEFRCRGYDSGEMIRAEGASERVSRKNEGVGEQFRIKFHIRPDADEGSGVDEIAERGPQRWKPVDIAEE